MTAPQSNVTVKNLIIGPCSSFQVDGTELGGTANGVEMEKKQKNASVTVDQVASDVKEGLEDEEYNITTELAEGTLSNLQIAWGLDSQPTTDASSGVTTLNLGAQQEMIERTLSFTGPAPSGKTRTFTNNRVVAMVSGKAKYDRKDQLTYPVDFKILPDLSSPGKEYGTVTDSSS